MAGSASSARLSARGMLPIPQDIDSKEEEKWTPQVPLERQQLRDFPQTRDYQHRLHQLPPKPDVGRHLPEQDIHWRDREAQRGQPRTPQMTPEPQAPTSRRSRPETRPEARRERLTPRLTTRAWSQEEMKQK